MIGAPNSSKLIFTILLHGHSPEEFAKLRERQFKRQYPSARREKYREEFDTSHSPLHRYNDVAGYAEFYWDGGTRLLVDFIFRGDGRKRYGKAVGRNRPGYVSSHQFYLWDHELQVSGIPHRSCDEHTKRAAVLEGLELVCSKAEEMGCFVDVTNERKLVDAFNLHLLL